MQAIKAAGGRVIVQDPETAEQRSMPWNALATGCVDLVLDPARIADALVALVAVPGAAELFGVRGGSWASRRPPSDGACESAAARVPGSQCATGS